GFRMLSRHGRMTHGAAEPENGPGLTPRSRTEPPGFPAPRGGPGEAAAAEGLARVRTFAVGEDTGPLTSESMEDADGILTQAISWNRRGLIAAAEEMMAGDLSTPRRSYLFGGLVNLLSVKDRAGAL